MLESHLDNISLLQYNDENSLVHAVHLAYLYAEDYYTFNRELPLRKGYADIVLIPRSSEYPPIIIELKYNKSAIEAIA